MAELPSRLLAVIGAPLNEIDEAALQRLVDQGVREEPDLDFKRDRYGNGDGDKRELAADIAAMANHQGGLLIIGVNEESEVASERTPVDLADGEENRVRQIATALIAPYVDLNVKVVASDEDAARGYYLLLVPASPLRPHAVRKDNDLRYPRRDGTTKRWLSEAEVADLCRDRFRLAVDQTRQVRAILNEGLAAMETSGDEAFLAVGLVPTTPGAMTIDLASVSQTEEWAAAQGRARWWTGFFGDRPRGGVGARRLRLGLRLDGQRPPNYYCSELHADGSGFACTRLAEPRRRSGWEIDPEDTSTWVLNGELLMATARCLRLLARHATEHTGCWGDCIVETRVVQPPLRLAYTHYLGGVEYFEAVEGSPIVETAIDSRHRLLLEASLDRTPIYSRARGSSRRISSMPLGRQRSATSLPTGSCGWRPLEATLWSFSGSRSREASSWRRECAPVARQRPPESGGPGRPPSEYRSGRIPLMGRN